MMFAGLSVKAMINSLRPLSSNYTADLSPLQSRKPLVNSISISFSGLIRFMTSQPCQPCATKALLVLSRLDTQPRHLQSPKSTGNSEIQALRLTDYIGLYSPERHTCGETSPFSWLRAYLRRLLIVATSYSRGNGSLD